MEKKLWDYGQNLKFFKQTYSFKTLIHNGKLCYQEEKLCIIEKQYGTMENTKYGSIPKITGLWFYSKLQVVQYTIFTIVFFFGGREPGHIAPLLDGLRTQTPREIVDEAIILDKDIYARSDIDLGEFTALDHHIDTDTIPVKQRILRTPTV